MGSDSLEGQTDMYLGKIVFVMVFALPLALTTDVGRASAQATTPAESYFQPLVVDISFPFHAGGETLVAGKYFVEQATSELVMLRSANGQAVEVPISTRLAQPPTKLREPAVSFDKVGNAYFISEVWIPGRDGFLLSGTMVPHAHVTIKAAWK